MSFKKFVPPMVGMGRGRSPLSVPTVNITLGKTTRFHFNSAAILRYLADKTCVEYFYDENKKLIGFKFYKERLPGTYSLTLAKIGTGGNSRVVASASAFLDYHGLRSKLQPVQNRTFVLYTSDEDADLVLCDISEVLCEENSSGTT